MIKAIAIDDELPALKVVETFCQKVGDIELLKTFNMPTEALKYVRQFPVDLLFLDINMPSLSGIEFYKAVQQNTMVIFTTAYSEYAVEGFSLNAVDYLLKPFTYKRFQQAVEKAKDFYAFTKQKKQDAPKHIFIRADYMLIKIDITDILFIEGLDDYLKIHLQNQKPVTARMTMKAMAEKLPEDKFLRVHRSFIVPLSGIKSMRGKILYVGSEEIPIGSSYEEQLLKHINK